MNDDRRTFLKELPKVDEVLVLMEKVEDMKPLPRSLLVDACRYAIESMRREILRTGGGEPSRPTADDALEA
ncbi:MAG: hypothetical protein PHU03_04520, partial [Syntrophales bacterium]|nr:hypothetical protein [Syntrophales bacterium]